MGMGRFKNGRFDLVVVANFAMSATDVTEWRRSFAKASELFFDASEGQVQFGRIFVCDDSVGLDAAEMILHASGDPSYGTFGKFGQPGQALHLMPYVKFQVLTHLHEMGHHVWALGEEYAGEAVLEAIDTTVVPPNNSTIPLVASTFGAGALVGNDAILKFGTTLERRGITANTATSVTVSPAFSQSPVNDSDGNVQYQFPAECATAANPSFCIMENSRSAAGTLDAAGTWTPAAAPVTEFCTDSNHDPDGNTQQEIRNHDSCWETIKTRAGFTTLTVPNPASPGPATGSTVPDWIVLEKQLRFSVVVDRSGSMASGHKMADAKHGAIYWLEYCGVGTDLLSVVAYDDQIDATLVQTEVSTLGGLAGTTAAINALTPRGATDIRDALFRARDEIESLPTRAAVQVVLLLTDGVHNSPFGSSPLEALPDLQEGGIRVYSLGVGSPGDVDMAPLNALATGTGGRSYAVGDNQASLIENKMVEINAEVRGGIITTEPVIFPDSRSGAIDKVIGKSEKPVDPRRRPPLDRLLEALRISDVQRLYPVGGRSPSNRAVAIPVDVEDGADRASFTVTHPDTVDVWLYLLDPSGAVVDTSPGASATQVASSAPHEFIVVEHPDPGRWTLVAVRMRAGAAFTAHVVAGGENRNLQAFADAPAVNPTGGPVPITATARWGHELTGLKARAIVTAPSGARRAVALHDELADGGGSGQYTGLHTPTENGRHEAIVTVRGSSAASMADPYRQLAHVDGDSVDTAVKVPRFVRQVVVDFHVGELPPIRQKPESPHKRRGERPRPVPLVSAGRKRRR
jgi:von Willebrand factor type A domain-containing protein